MEQLKLSPIEKLVAKKIEQTKTKVSQPGYIKELITKLYPKIEDALARGCEYEDIAKSICETQIKIKVSTLKQYHVANRREQEKAKQQLSSKQPQAIVNSHQNASHSEGVLAERQFQEIIQTENPKSSPPLDRQQSAIDKLFANK